MSRTLKVGLVQQQAWPDKQRSLEASEVGIRELAAQGAELVLLQELHATHYFCQCEDTELFDLAEPLDGPTGQRLATLARELDIVIIGSIFERRAAGLYHNTAIVLDRARGRVGHYRKMHIPDDPGFYEKFYFTPGDLGFDPFKIKPQDPEKLLDMQEKELSHGRLAMIAAMGFLAQETVTGQTWGAFWGDASF